MFRRKAFTLVELLVVIAIIALLISILAPSLQSAKQLVKQAICMTNVRSVTMSIAVYAEANRGSVPGHFPNGGLPEAVYYTYCAFKGEEGVNPDDGLIGVTNVGRRSFGWVYTLKVITEPSLFYCPTSPQLMGQYNTYPKPWGSAMPPPSVPLGTGHIRTSYMYNPNVTLNGTTLEYTVGPQIGTFDNEHALVIDIACRDDLFSHTPDTGASGYKWNVGFADGHAAGKSSGKVTALIKMGALPNNSENLWPDFNLIYNYLMKEQ